MTPQHMQYAIKYVSFLHWLQKQDLIAKGTLWIYFKVSFPCSLKKKKKKIHEWIFPSMDANISTWLHNIVCIDH